MAYVESPIMEGKDFKSIVADVNGNFDEIQNSLNYFYGKWEKVGEFTVNGQPSNFNDYSGYGGTNIRKERGVKFGSIQFDGDKYEKIYLCVKGEWKAMDLLTPSNKDYPGADYLYEDTLTTSKPKVYYNNQSGWHSVESGGEYKISDAASTNAVTIYWRCKKEEKPNVFCDVTISLYALKKPQWLIDELGIT